MFGGIARCASFFSTPYGFEVAGELRWRVLVRSHRVLPTKEAHRRCLVGLPGALHSSAHPMDSRWRASFDGECWYVLIGCCRRRRRTGDGSGAARCASFFSAPYGFEVAGELRWRGLL